MSSTLNLRRCYLAFTWKRCFGRLGKLLCGLALLGIICAAAIYGLSFVNQKNDTAAASHFNVVFVMPKNAGLHYSLALGMVSNMESLSSMVTIKQTTSEDEAKAMLDSGEVKAAVIIPEGMIDPLVPFSQSEQMVKRLEECGADVSFICVDHAEHEGSFWSLPLLDNLL